MKPRDAEPPGLERLRRAEEAMGASVAKRAALRGRLARRHREG